MTKDKTSVSTPDVKQSSPEIRSSQEKKKKKEDKREEERILN